jgi:Flp pilus assembly protein TadD
MFGVPSLAIAQFETLLEPQPSNRFAREALESARRELDDRGDTADPSSLPSTPLERAVAERRAGDLDAAERHLRRALEEDPQHARAHNELGMIYGRRGDYEAAVVEYRRGLRFEPDNYALLMNLGAAYARSGDVAGARRSWERCLELRPEDAQVRRALRALETKRGEDG